MQKRKGAAKKSSPDVSLHIGSSFADAWPEIIRPWFESLAIAASSSAALDVVVTPYRSAGYAIKRLLLDCGISFLGIRFMSPTDLRELLATRSNCWVAPREHLRLLLSIAAEQCMELPDDTAAREKRMLEADFLAAKSVLRTPDHLLRTIDRLGAAGWDLNAVEIPALRTIAAKFDRQLADCGFHLPHIADARALADSKTQPPLFNHVLVTGFNGPHWPFWPVLRAAVGLAKNATVILENPHDQAQDIDEAWVGTWENAFGPAKPISAPINRTNETLFTEEEMQGLATGPTQRAFLVGANTTQQASAIAKQCVHFLADPNCERIGIVFPRGGSLSRLVADALANHGIPHHDGLAHLIPGFFEAADWRAWIQLQESPRVESIVRFMNALPQGHELFHGLRPETFEQTLRSAYADILIDDVEILKRACAQAQDASEQAIAAALDVIVFLPARARLAEFLRVTRNALDRLGWERHWLDLSRYLGPWTERIDDEFSRAIYLRWLQEIAYSFSISRDPLGVHPYAPVQLLTVTQACGQDWSHIVFAGANEGSWPPPETGEFIREGEIDAFNQTTQHLNRRAVQQGRQGEGHVSITESHGFYIGPREQRQIACRQFDALLESTRRKITFTASLVQEEAPERFWNPSELLTRQYLEARKRPLTQQTMTRLQCDTERWLGETSDRAERNDSSPIEKEPTRIAYDARRNPNTASGDYDFAFRSKPPLVPTLSVSDFEQLLSAPALVWLKKYVGVKAAADNDNVWNSTSGKWVHDWLAAIAAGTTRTFSSLPNPTEIEKRVCDAALAKRACVARLCQEAGKSLPDWWIGGWRNAAYLARILAEKLTEVTDWPWMATEWTIQDDGAVEIIPKVTLRLRGRIDLLLARTKPADSSLATNDLWIVDYKTGAKRALSTARQGPDGRRAALKKKLLDGSALQLGLYALTAARLGAAQIEVSILSPFVRCLAPQISATDFASETEIFAELARMQQTGAFGMHGPLRSAFRFTDDYPLATVAVDSDILEQRWELTHPALVRDEEDMFW